MSEQPAAAAPPPTRAEKLIRAGWLWTILNSVLSVVIFLALWEGLLRLFDVPVWLVPKPSDFLGRFLVDYREILSNALATSVTLAAGFGLGVVIAVPLALLMVSIGALERGLYPVIVFLNIMPKTVIGPILIIWFGVSPLVSVLVVFLMCFFPVLVDSMHGFRIADPRLNYLTRSMGATPWQAFRYVRLPASMSYIFAGMRIGIVKAVEGVIIAEFIGSSAGLGFMIMRASSFMNMELLFCGLVAVAIVALLFNILLGTSERIMMPWIRPR
ncbi:MAG: ABC transporter permease [Pseudolabrys sp.]|jgi:NitT/TauT family transport system permease protein|nr:ABC transporter permease [Pseudolabrys sp.]